MGKLSELFGARAVNLSAPVHEWSAKKVKTWAKGKNLPKAVCKRLGQLSGKQLLCLDAHRFCAMLDKQPDAACVNLLDTSLAELRQTVSQPWVRPGRLVSPQQPAQAKQSPTRRWQNLSPAEHIDASRSPRKLSAPLPQRQAAAPTAFASTDPLPGTKRGVYAAHQARQPSNDGAIMQPTMQTVDAPLPAAAHISASERSSDRDIPAGFARSAPGGKAHEPALGGPAAGDTAGSIMLSETPAAHDDHTTGVLGSAPLGSSAAPQPALWHGNTADVHASGATPHPMSDADVVNQTSATVPAKAPQNGGPESVPYSAERALDTDLEQTVSVAAGDSSAAVHTALQSEDVSPKAHTNGLARPASETTQAHSSVGLKLAQWNLQAASAATTARSGVLSAAGDLSPIALAGHSSAASSHQLHIAEHATFIASFAEGAISSSRAAAVLSAVERPKDLVDACRMDPAVGCTVAKVLKTHDVCSEPQCIRATGERLQAFCLRVLSCYSVVGFKELKVPYETSRIVMGAFDGLIKLLRTFARQGWFLHLAFMNDVKGRFDALHNCIVDALVAAGAAEVPTGKRLLPGDYSDPTRALRRTLKQLGSGGIAAGVGVTARDPSAQVSVASVLAVPQHALGEELARLPRSAGASNADVDLGKMYERLCAIPQHAQHTDGSEEGGADKYRDVFEWYDEGGKGYLDARDVRAVLRALGMLDGVADRDQYVAAQLALASRSGAKRLTCEEFCAYYASLQFAGERHALRAALGIAGEEDLRAQFLAFANFASHGEPTTDMDGAHFAKYCADCHVTGRGPASFGRRALTSTDVDLAFARVKAKGARRIDFGAFVHALGALAEQQGAGVADIAAHCLRFVAPSMNATSVAEDVRLHDDKSTYTGVYSRGGPTNVDRPKDLSGIANRKPADQRGVALPFRRASELAQPRGRSAGVARSARLDGSPTASVRSGALTSRASSIMGGEPRTARGRPSFGGGTSGLSFMSEQRTTRSRPSVGGSVAAADHVAGYENMPPLNQVFVAFALFGKGHAGADLRAERVRMDGKAFAKLIKESGCMGRGLDATRVDLCFAKACDKVTRRMNFAQFKNALEACAAARDMHLDTLTHAVASTQPHVSGTVAAAVKWHDDRRTYTGVHAKGGPNVLDKKFSLQDMLDRDAANLTHKRRGGIAAWA